MIIPLSSSGASGKDPSMPDLSKVRQTFTKSLKFTVEIPQEVKKTLDQLFERSPYSIDNMKVYPEIIGKHGTIRTECMTEQVMKGKTKGGTRFIAIWLECDLTTAYIDQVGINEIFKAPYRAKPHLEEILFLHQHYIDGPAYWGGRNEFNWFQQNADRFEPKFFTGNFTCPKTALVTPSQEENFKKVQTLLQTGESVDNNGLTWRIRTNVQNLKN